MLVDSARARTALVLTTMILAYSSTVSQTEAAANLPSYEIKALRDLYYATNGTNWEYAGNGAQWSFTDTTNPCTEEWEGVFCILPLPRTVYHVADLSLVSMNLRGSIPPSIGNFTRMAQLFIGGNFLTHRIPSAIGRLTQLTKLQLQDNGLTGSIPDSICDMVKLTYIDLSVNFLTGTIPQHIGDMKALQLIDFSTNHIHGSIPQSIGNLSVLHTVAIAVNALSGSLPDTWSGMISLVYLALSSNFLHGTLPPSFTTLSLLSNLIMYGNKLSGTIPADMVNMKSLAYLTMPNNHFTGTLPDSMVNMTSLLQLTLGENHFNGTVPDFLAHIPHLTSIGLYSNDFTGTIPAVLGNASQLIDLDLGLNPLHGSIPPELGRLNNLQYLGFSNALISGTLPPELGNLRKLLSLDLGNMMLHGTLPGSLSGLASIQDFSVLNNSFTGALDVVGTFREVLYITVYNNYFTGTIPASVSQLRNLTSLQVQNNALTGTINELFDVSVQTSLQSIQVSSNQLTGTLPDEVFRIPTLISFISMTNCFHGELPAALCEATALQTLELGALHTASQCRRQILPGLSSTYTLADAVSGAVPACLFNLPQLTKLRLSSNAFTGSFPPDLVVAPQLQALSLSYNKLTGSIPHSIQRRAWTELDLSYNRFSGTLSVGFAHYEKNQSVSLQYNRLSGAIPGALHAAAQVSVLQSNIFSCAVDGNDLPRHDDYRSHYLCGSESTDVPYYVWLCCAAVMVVFLSLAVRYRRKLDHVGTLANLIVVAGEWLAVSSPQSVTEDKAICNTVPSLSYIASVARALGASGAVCAVFAVLVLGPAYAILTVYCGTHTYEYIWTVSAVLLEGVTALTVEIVLLTALTMAFVVAYHRFVLVLRPCALEVVAESIDERATETTRERNLKWANVCLYVAINFGVVGVVNAYYVFVKLNSSTAYQVLISAFKIVWSSLCAPYLSRHLLHPRPVFATLELAVSLCNTIVIPIICVIFVSPDCFYNVFVPDSDVTVYYTNAQCAAEGDTGCAVILRTTSFVSFPPPYLYNFQCSYVFADFYVPAFIYVCLMATFGVPLIELFLLYLHRRAAVNTTWYWCVERVLPRVLKKYTSDTVPVEQRDRFRPMFDATQFVITQLTFLCQLMTFGAVFPPLAVSLALTMVCTTTFARLKVGRLLTHTRAVNLVGYTEIVEAECAGVAPPVMLQRAMWMIVHLSAAFYALFLFDTYGARPGFQAAYWVLIAVPLLPSAAYCIYYVLSAVLCGEKDATRSSPAVDEPESMELSIVSLSENEGRDTMSALHAVPSSV